MSRILTLNVPVTEEEFASLIARFADRAILSTTDGGASLTIAPTDTDEDDDGTDSTATTGLDSAGVPWMEGIHSSSKKQNADGTWRLMKGVDKDKAAAAIAAYKQQTLPPVPTYAPPVAQTAPAPLPEVTAAPVQPIYTQPIVAPVAGLPGMPPVAAPAPIPAPVVEIPVSYDQIIAKAQALATYPNVDFPGIYAAAGVTDANVLMNDETLRRTLMNKMNEAEAALKG